MTATTAAADTGNNSEKQQHERRRRWRAFAPLRTSTNRAATICCPTVTASACSTTGSAADSNSLLRRFSFSRSASEGLQLLAARRNSRPSTRHPLLQRSSRSASCCSFSSTGSKWRKGVPVLEVQHQQRQRKRTLSSVSSLDDSTNSSACDVAPNTPESRRPRAGSSTEQLVFLDEDLDDELLLQKIQQQHNFDGALLSARDGDEKESQRQQQRRIRWRTCTPELMPVRSSCYLTTKQKIPSPGELYRCVKVDFIESSHRLRNVSNRVELPDPDEYLQKLPSTTNRTWHAPDVFVVTLSLPRDPNGLGMTPENDGPSHTICMYFVIKQETRDALARITSPLTSSSKHAGDSDDTSESRRPHTAAIRLFDEWCRRAPDDPKFQGRFKFVPCIQNLDRLGLPSWISKWNNKPLLIKRTGKTGFLYRHEDASCLEMEISFHPFPWAAKHAIQYLRQNLLHKLLLTFGFVIEGREDSELPETLIGLSQLCFARSENAVLADKFFGSDVVKLRSIHSGVWRHSDAGEQGCEDDRCDDEESCV